MPRIVEPDHNLSLADYSAVAPLASAVAELRTEAARYVPLLRDRVVWAVNSTEHGGGVAEMLPAQISLLRELGVDVRWVVIDAPEHPEFFELTKRIHNLIHGQGDPRLDDGDRALYDAVSRDNAEWLERQVGDGDIVIIHDPQPLGAGAYLRERRHCFMIWRCHIGLDERLPATVAAWKFLKPYATRADRAVFTAPEYIPGYLAGRAVVIHPAIDPLSHKNRELPIHKLTGVLCSSGLLEAHGPTVYPQFDELAQRLQPDGGWGAARDPQEPALVWGPVITQVSRWDRLKGFVPLLRGFEVLKQRAPGRDGLPPLHQRLLEAVRLVLAGPDPLSVQDDPEAVGVLEEIRARYMAMSSQLQREVVVLSLPMGSRKHNALMVNALQRCSTIVVQNSLQEGFGLTATEAMWKGVAVLGTRAVGLRQQIRDRIDGRLVADAEDPEEIARVLDEMLGDEWAREQWGRTAQHRVHHEFLIFTQLRRWLELLAET